MALTRLTGTAVRCRIYELPLLRDRSPQWLAALLWAAVVGFAFREPAQQVGHP